MSYKVELTHKAAKETEALGDEEHDHVLDAFEELKHNPRPRGVRKLQNRDNDWRIKVGRLRIIYSIDDEKKLVIIRRVAHRKDVYMPDCAAAILLMISDAPGSAAVFPSSAGCCRPRR